MRCRALHVDFEVAGPLPPRWLDALRPLASGTGAGPAAARFELREVGGRFALTRPAGAEPGMVEGDADELLSAVFDWVRVAARGPAAEVVVHAGSVRRGERVLLLPGISGVGKSTLVATLVGRGWELLSDELVGIAADGSLLPCPLPLRLDRRSCEVVGAPFTGGRDKAEVAVTDLGGSAGGAYRSTDVVLLGRAPGPPQLTPVSRAAVVALLADSVFAGADPGRALTLLAAATTGARTWRLTSSDPRAACEAVLAAVVG